MILFINGSLGVGKTSVAHDLLWRHPQTVLLEGDALCNIHPFDAYSQDRIGSVMEILRFMVVQYRKIGYTRFIVDSVFEKEAEIATLDALLGEVDGEIFHILLHATAEARKGRIEARRRENYLWELERSAELQGLLLAEFGHSPVIRLVDTTDKTVSQVGDEILGGASSIAPTLSGVKE